MGRRGWHAHVDFLGRGRWGSQFFFGESLKASQTVRKGLGFCSAMIFGFAAGDDGHDADGGRGGHGGDGDLDQWFHGKPSMLVFHNFGDVNAVVMGFGKGLLGLFDIFLIDVKFLDTGIFPEVELETER